MGFTQANEKTAIACLTQHDWRLDIASDRFFQNNDQFFRDHAHPQSRPVPVDCKKIEQIFIAYRGKTWTVQIGSIAVKFGLFFRWN